jgi:hypothetical protein
MFEKDILLLSFKRDNRLLCDGGYLINDIILQGERTKMAFESPPLWVWAIIVGVLIASKFIYRWRATKELARESQEKHERTERAKG